MGKKRRGQTGKSHKAGKQASMIHEPQAHGKDNEPEQSDNGAPSLVASVSGTLRTELPTPASEQKTQQGAEATHQRKYQSKYQAGKAAVAVWGWIKRRGEWFDRHHGSVTAFATLVICGLTAVYAFFSWQQWQAMRTQSSIMQRQLRDSEQVQIARLEVNVTPLERPTVLKAVADKTSDSILIDWTIKVTNLGPTIARALNFTADAANIANTHGEFDLDRRIIDRFSTISPKPSPFGRILKMTDNNGFSYRTQIPGLGKLMALQASLVIMMQISYIDVFDQAQGVPDCVYYSASQRGFVQCPLIVREIPQPTQQTQSGPNK